jgi:uncharacterized membrane protein
MLKCVTLYLTLTTVSASTIIAVTGTAPLKALATAAIGCLGKTVAVKVHEFVWSKFRKQPVSA